MNNANVLAIARYINRQFGDDAKTFLVGGAMRDHFFKTTPKDFDLLVSGVNVEYLGDALRNVSNVVDVDFVGKAFGVFKVKFADGEVIDVAVPRTEVSFGAGHKDFTVNTNNVTVEQDLARRDFTMNAIAGEICPHCGSFESIIDPFNGRKDIDNKIVRCVGDAGARFVEDPLRILRAFRFLARYYGYGFGFANGLDIEVRRNAHLLNTVSPERVGEEFLKIAGGYSAHAAIASMARTGVLETIVPEWKACVGFEQRNPYHGMTVDNHILEVVRNTRKETGGALVTVAALLHDIGKPATFSIDEKGVGHFYGHEAVGARMSETILRRMRIPEEFIKNVSTLIENHQRPGSNPSGKAIRKFVAELGNIWPQAVELFYADSSSHINVKRIDWYNVYKTIVAQCKSNNDIAGFGQQKVALDGRTLFSEFGFDGIKIGKCKKMLVKAIIEGEVANEREALREYVASHMAEISV